MARNLGSKLGRGLGAGLTAFGNIMLQQQAVEREDQIRREAEKRRQNEILSNREWQVGEWNRQQAAKAAAATAKYNREHAPIDLSAASDQFRSDYPSLFPQQVADSAIYRPPRQRGGVRQNTALGDMVTKAMYAPEEDVGEYAPFVVDGEVVPGMVVRGDEKPIRIQKEVVDKDKAVPVWTPKEHKYKDGTKVYWSEDQFGNRRGERTVLPGDVEGKNVLADVRKEQAEIRREKEDRQRVSDGIDVANLAFGYDKGTLVKTSDRGTVLSESSKAPEIAWISDMPFEMLGEARVEFSRRVSEEGEEPTFALADQVARDVAAGYDGNLGRAIQSQLREMFVGGKGYQRTDRNWFEKVVGGGGLETQDAIARSIGEIFEDGEIDDLEYKTLAGIARKNEVSIKQIEDALEKVDADRARLLANYKPPSMEEAAQMQKPENPAPFDPDTFNPLNDDPFSAAENDSVFNANIGRSRRTATRDY